MPLCRLDSSRQGAARSLLMPAAAKFLRQRRDIRIPIAAQAGAEFFVLRIRLPQKNSNFNADNIPGIIDYFVAILALRA